MLTRFCLPYKFTGKELDPEREKFIEKLIKRLYTKRRIAINWSIVVEIILERIYLNYTEASVEKSRTRVRK